MLEISWRDDITSFKQALVDTGWEPANAQLELAWSFSKGDYELFFDTSHWMELSAGEKRLPDSDTQVPGSDGIEATIDRIDELIERHRRS